jgi:putative endonuclease
MHQYWVYMMTNNGNTVLYIGVTSDVQRRVFEHRVPPEHASFCWKYQCWKLAWMEEHNDINDAIAREKQLKNWKRAWKEQLIEKLNPAWSDLSIEWDYTGWFDPSDPPPGYYRQHIVGKRAGNSRDAGSSPA